MNYINPYQLAPTHRLQSMVEHREAFNLDDCELNVFETREQASDFKLKFSGFTVTSMLRGKKVMQLEDSAPFDYLPGQSVLAPSEMLMNIGFPEAHPDSPTQCTALVIDEQYLRQQIAQINERKSTELELDRTEWKINYNNLVLDNTSGLTQISNRLIKVFTSDDPFKDFHVDLILKELVLNLLRIQNLNAVRLNTAQHHSSDPFCAVLRYIENNITEEISIQSLCKVAGMSKSSFYSAFQEHYGMSPVQLVLEERLKYAKQLLCEERLSVKEVAYASGFNDPNYFSRFFRKMEGISPSAFRCADE